MIWPLGAKHRAEIEAEQARLQAEIDHTRAIRVRLIKQWPAVRSIAGALVKRRDENGFGEELEVAWTPRGKNHG